MNQFSTKHYSACYSFKSLLFFTVVQISWKKHVFFGFFFFNRCRWSWVIWVPTGTIPIGSWSSVSFPWSRNWTSWVAASTKPRSFCLRSYISTIPKSGEDSEMLLMLCTSLNTTLKDVVNLHKLLNQDMAAQRNDIFVLLVLLQMTWLHSGHLAIFNVFNHSQWKRGVSSLIPQLF